MIYLWRNYFFRWQPGGTTAVPARAATNLGKNLLKREAESVLSKSLSSGQMTAVNKAHRVEKGEQGKEKGTFARVGNYTTTQLKTKLRILRTAGLEKEDRKKLLKKGIVGNVTWNDRTSQSSISQFNEAACKISSNKEKLTSTPSTIRATLPFSQPFKRAEQKPSIYFFKMVPTPIFPTNSKITLSVQPSTNKTTGLSKC